MEEKKIKTRKLMTLAGCPARCHDNMLYDFHFILRIFPEVALCTPLTDEETEAWNVYITHFLGAYITT